MERIADQRRFEEEQRAARAEDRDRETEKLTSADKGSPMYRHHGNGNGEAGDGGGEASSSAADSAGRRPKGLVWEVPVYMQYRSDIGYGTYIGYDTAQKVARLLSVFSPPGDDRYLPATIPPGLSSLRAIRFFSTVMHLFWCLEISTSHVYRYARPPLRQPQAPWSSTRSSAWRAKPLRGSLPPSPGPPTPAPAARVAEAAAQSLPRRR